MAGIEIRRKIKCGIFIALLCLLVSPFVFSKYERTEVSNNRENVVDDGSIGEITEGKAVTQVIPVSRDISAISILFESGGRANSGEVTIRVEGARGLYFDHLFGAGEFKDGSFVPLMLNRTVRSSEEASLTITVRSNSRPGQGISVRVNSRSQIAGARLLFGGDPVAGNLTYETVSVDRFPSHDLGKGAILGLIVLFSGLAALFLGDPSPGREEDRAFHWKDYAIVFLLGMAILACRSAYCFLSPSLYAEDGKWLGGLIHSGFWHMVTHANDDYFVVGNLLLLKGALSINGLFRGDDLSYIPVFIALMQQIFYCLTALLPMAVFKRELSKPLRIVLALLILLVPLGDSAAEVWGKSVNIGFVFSLIALCLVYWRVFYRDELGWRRIVAIDIVLFLCCVTNPVSYVLVAFGFFFDMALQLAAERGRRGGGLLRTMASRPSNVLWVLLGLCCAVAAFYDLVFMPDVNPTYGNAVPDRHMVVEFFARSVLFYVIYPFYGNMRDSVTLAMMAVFAALTMAVFVSARIEGRRKLKLLFLGVAVAVNLATTFFARGAITGYFNQYGVTFPDRYYYVLNILSLVLLIHVLQLYSVGGIHRKVIAGAVLALLMMNPWINPAYLFEYDSPRYHQTEGRLFPDCMRDAVYVPEEGLYKVPINPRGWHMMLPAESLEASSVPLPVAAGTRGESPRRPARGRP